MRKGLPLCERHAAIEDAAAVPVQQEAIADATALSEAGRQEEAEPSGVDGVARSSYASESQPANPEFARGLEDAAMRLHLAEKGDTR